MRRRRRYSTQTIRKKNNHPTTSTHSIPKSSQGKGKSWVWFFVVILILCTIAYYIYTLDWSLPGSSEKKSQPVESVKKAPEKKPEVREPIEVKQPVVTAEHKIQIEILNGCGKSGIARSFENYLKEAGFDVVNTDNYVVKGKVTWNVPQSMVIDMVGKPEQARAVARALGISDTNVLSENRPEAFWDVRVVIGLDLEHLNGYSAN